MPCGMLAHLSPGVIALAGRADKSAVGALKRPLRIAGNKHGGGCVVVEGDYDAADDG